MGRINDARLKLLDAKFEMTPLGGWNLFHKSYATVLILHGSMLDNVLKYNSELQLRSTAIATWVNARLIY